MKTWKTLSILATVLTVVGLGSISSSFAAEEKAIEQQIAEAETLADHEAIAAFYAAEAKAAQELLTQHKRMRDSYRMRYPIKRALMVSHCDKLIAKYGELTTEYKALATLHTEMTQSSK